MLSVWDAQGSKFLLKISSHCSISMAFSSDGHFFASVDAKAGIYIWKESPGGYIIHQKITSITPGFFTTPHFSPNRESIVVTLSSMICLWHTKNPILSSNTTLAKNNLGSILQFSPNQTLAAFVCYQGNSVTVVDLQSDNKQLTINTGMQVKGLGLTRSTIVVVGNERIVTWNLAAWNASANINDSIQITMFKFSPPSHFGESCGFVSISPDLSRIVSHKLNEELGLGHLEIFDVSTGRCLVSVICSAGVSKLLLAPNNFRITDISGD